MKKLGLMGIFSLGVFLVWFSFSPNTENKTQQEQVQKTVQSVKAVDQQVAQKFEAKKQNMDIATETTVEPALATPQVDEKLVKLEKEWKARIFDELGEDELGQTAFGVAKRVYLSMKNKKEEAGVNCQKQATCPMELEEFYSQALSKASLGELSQVKQLLQAEMLTSELAPEKKMQLLESELLSITQENFEGATYIEDGRAILDPASLYLITTQNRLLASAEEPSEYVQSSLAAIAATNDQAGRFLLARSLVEHLGDEAHTVNDQLVALGFTEQALSVIYQ